ncbi:hypothetical protein OG582_16000 [Streptomyces anulatus]|uniref:hypothetical protein n=1 Tax=Streptomyces anulatus TaxID=1892 RepID=UPI0032547C3F
MPLSVLGGTGWACLGHDLADFLALAADWARVHLPQHAEPVIDALVRVLPVPANGVTRTAA